MYPFILELLDILSLGTIWLISYCQRTFVGKEKVLQKSKGLSMSEYKAVGSGRDRHNVFCDYRPW